MSQSQTWVRNTVLRGLLLFTAALACSSGCAGFEDGACYVGTSCTYVSNSTCSLEGGDFKANQQCSGSAQATHAAKPQ